jgi:hypothetical protein
MEIHSSDIPTSLKPTPERVAELDRLGDAIAELSAASRGRHDHSPHRPSQVVAEERAHLARFLHSLVSAFSQRPERVLASRPQFLPTTYRPPRGGPAASC